MPRARGVKQILSPNGGIITEQSPLSPREDSSIDERNMDFSQDLTARLRRLGLNKEDSAVNNFIALIETPPADYAVVHDVWEAVGDDASRVFHVIQIAQYLYFIEDKQLPLSGGMRTFSVDLSTRIPAGSSATVADVQVAPVSMTSALGGLIVVAGVIEPLYITLQDAGNNVDMRVINLYIRDFKGVEEDIGIDIRPDTLSDEHEYNLHNQGWYQQRKRLSDSAEVDPIVQFETDVGDYPSNADIAYLGMVDNGSGQLRFDAESIEDLSLGNTRAPQGHYIIDPFNINYVNLLTGAEGNGSPALNIALPGDAGSVAFKATIPPATEWVVPEIRGGVDTPPIS